MKRHVTLFFLSICITSIHCAQASLIPPLTEVEKLVYPCGFSETTSFCKREVVYSKNCVHIFATEGLFIRPLHECNVPHKAKEVCSSCYTRLFTNSSNVIKNRIGNLEKQHPALPVDALNTERAISKLRGLSTRLSNNYESAHEKMLSSEKTIDNKPFMELIYCAVESPIEVLNIINACLALIAVVKKADCLSFRPLKGVSDDPQYRDAILKNMIKECCDHAPKLLIPQQDIVTCVQFGNVRTFSTTIYSVAYEEGGITTECCIACPVACHILEIQKHYDKKYKDGKIYFPDNLPQPGENEVFGAGEDGDFVPRHIVVSRC